MGGSNTHYTLYTLCALYIFYTSYTLDTLHTREKGKFGGPQGKREKVGKDCWAQIPLATRPRARTHALPKRKEKISQLASPPNLRLISISQGEKPKLHNTCSTNAHATSRPPAHARTNKRNEANRFLGRLDSAPKHRYSIR